jgi:hypothetical protein
VRGIGLRGRTAVVFSHNLSSSNAFARIRSIASRGCAIVVSLARPLVYLWPWLVGVGVLAAVISSPQGIVLAERYGEEAHAGRVLVACTLASWLSVVLACLLALMAAAIRRPLHHSEGPSSRWVVRLRLFAGSLWVVSLASAYGVVLACAVNLNIVWAAVGSLALIGGVGTLWVTYSACYEGSAAARILAAIQRHHFVVISMGLLLATAPLAVGALVAQTTPMQLAAAGPLLIAMIGAASIATLFGLIVIVVPVYLRRPWIGVTYLAVMIGWAAVQPLPIDRDNPLLRDAVEAARKRFENDPTCKRAPLSLDAALQAHTVGPPYASSVPLDRSIYLVSAEGGGIRAAYWTALNLARLDMSTQGQFGEQVASLSGVSGGSLGIATWLAARDREDLTAAGRLKLATRFLSSDFLSPLLGGLLFLDVPRIFLGPAWPSARRDQVFEKAFVDQWTLIGKTNFFARPFLLGCMHGFKAVPAVYFNATDATTGAYVPLTASPLPSSGPIPPLSLSFDLHSSSIRDASVAQMVHISARFPYLSPGAKVGINASNIAEELEFSRLDENQGLNEEQMDEAIQEILERARKSQFWIRQWVLVDGGYFDNTGLTPTKKALALIEEGRGFEAMSPPLEAPRYTRTLVHLIHISNDPGTPCLPLPPKWQERLTPRARQFVGLTSGSTIRCARDIPALEESLVENVLSPLVVPLQSLLNARSEMSRQAVAELRDAYAYSRPQAAGPNLQFWTQFREISLSAGFADAFGIEAERQPKPDLLESARANLRKADRQLSDAKAEIRRLQREGKASDASVSVYLNQLAEWHDLIRNDVRLAECHRQLPQQKPPLGWTLSKTNQELMRCLSIRLGISNRSSDPILPPPWPAGWPLRFPGPFTPSFIRESMRSGEK